MSSRLQTEIDKSAQHFPEELILAARVTIYTDGDGLVHGDGFRGCATWSKTSQGGEGWSKMLLKDVLASDKQCPLCLNVKDLLPYNHISGWAQWILHAQDVMPKGQSARTVRQRQGMYRDMIKSHQRIQYDTDVDGYPDGGREVVEAYLEQFVKAEKECQKILSGGQAQNKLLHSIKVNQVGKKRADAGFVLDETPTLFGISSYYGPGLSGTTSRICETHALGEVKDHTHLLLVVPRYVADHLLVNLKRSSLTANAEGLSNDALETINGLWDPSSEGAMSSLVGAVQAARSLHDS